MQIGFFDFRGDLFISRTAIELPLLRDYLPRYLEVLPVPVADKQEMAASLLRGDFRECDYLYVDLGRFLAESFLLREKYELDVPLLIVLHSVFGFKETLSWIVPFFRECDMVIAPSEYARMSFEKITTKPRIAVVPYSIDLEFISRHSRPGLSGRKGVITFMGRLVEGKGVKDLVECMPAILKIEQDACLNIVGPLSGNLIWDEPRSRFVRHLQDRVAQLGIRDRVCFAGVKTGAEKYRALACSDLFVSPTTAPFETFHVVNAEALACGVPVITTQWAANSEIVRDGKNGFLIRALPMGGGGATVDREQLAATIVKVLGDRALHDRLRQNARSSVERFDFRRVVPRLLETLHPRVDRKAVKGRWEDLRNRSPVDLLTEFSEGCRHHLRSLGFSHGTYENWFCELFRKQKPVQVTAKPEIPAESGSLSHKEDLDLQEQKRKAWSAFSEYVTAVG